MREGTGQAGTRRTDRGQGKQGSDHVASLFVVVDELVRRFLAPAPSGPVTTKTQGVMSSSHTRIRAKTQITSWVLQIKKPAQGIALRRLSSTEQTQSDWMQATR
jgi:hypothetical protein